MSSTTLTHSEKPIETPGTRTLDMKLEVVVIPVSDASRSKRFYEGLGWRLDADFVVGDDVPGDAVHASGLAEPRSISATASRRPRPDPQAGFFSSCRTSTPRAPNSSATASR